MEEVAERENKHAMEFQPVRIVVSNVRHGERAVYLRLVLRSDVCNRVKCKLKCGQCFWRTVQVLGYKF